jgi:hypothetical protein
VLPKTRCTIIDCSLLISCLPSRKSRTSWWSKLLVRSSEIFKLEMISYPSEMFLRSQKSRQAALRGKFLPPSNTVRALLTACHSKDSTILEARGKTFSHMRTLHVHHPNPPRHVWTMILHSSNEAALQHESHLLRWKSDGNRRTNVVQGTVRCFRYSWHFFHHSVHQFPGNLGWSI